MEGGETVGGHDTKVRECTSCHRVLPTDVAPCPYCGGGVFLEVEMDLDWRDNKWIEVQIA